MTLIESALWFSRFATRHHSCTSLVNYKVGFSQLSVHWLHLGARDKPELLSNDLTAAAQGNFWAYLGGRRYESACIWRRRKADDYHARYTKLSVNDVPEFRIG